MREPRKRSQSGRVISIDFDAYHLGDFDRSDLAFWLKQIESVGEMSGCLVVESMMEMQSRVRQTLTWIYRRGCCPLTLASSLRDCGGFNGNLGPLLITYGSPLQKNGPNDNTYSDCYAKKTKSIFPLPGIEPAQFSKSHRT